MKRSFFLGLVACVFVLTTVAFGASDFPSKSLTIVCPYSPGGGSDLMVRTISQIIKDKKLCPEPVMVVNKTGGAGLIGKSFVYSSRADGYTITLADMGNVITPLTDENPPWQTQDWEYLANMVYDYNTLCVKTGTYKNMAELIKAAKAGTAPMTAGGTGSAGGPDSVCTVKLNQTAGIRINYVPMKGGGEVVTGLLGGHISMGWFNPSEIVSQIKAGQAVALAVTSPERISSMPDLPTFKELGYDFIYIQQRGLAMKKGAPPEVVDYWINLLGKVRQTKEWKTYLEKNMQEDGWLPGEKFAQWMKGEQKDFVNVMKILKEEAGKK